MLYATSNFFNKKLLPKNILILNARKKTETTVEFCLMHGINFKMFEIDKDSLNISPKLRPYTTFLPEEKLYDPQYFIKNLGFVPEYILNYRDEEPITTLEYELSLYWKTKTQFDKRALKFFTSKKEQDRICKLIGTPTLSKGSIDDKIIRKLDSGKSGGGSGHKIVWKKDYQYRKNDFIQRYINIDYNCNQHAIIDNNGEYHIYNHSIGKYGDGNPPVPLNVAYMFLYPYTDFSKEDLDIVHNFYKGLKKHITARNRILIPEFVRERNGKLYFQEFNCRPSGEFETGVFDWKVGNYNTLVDYFTGKITKNITYHEQRAEIYFGNVYNNSLFGWGKDDDRKSEPFARIQKVKVWNTKEK